MSEVSGLNVTGSCNVDVTTLANSGEATSGVDYVPLTQTVNIPIGNTVAVPAIMVLEDADSPESEEQFDLVITPSANAPCAVAGNNTATVTIEDVAPPIPPTVEFANLSSSGSEDDVVVLNLSLIHI